MRELATRIDRRSPEFRANEAASRRAVEELERQHRLACAGGGETYVERHRRRGKRLARERIELLVDRGAPFLELSPLAAWGSEYPVGGSVVTGIGVVSDVECVLIAHDPTVRGGAMNPFTLRKTLRAMDIARENRLPLLNLVESGGADLPRQSEIFVPAGEIFRNLTQLSGLGIPTVALVFGNATAGGAYVPGMCDYTVMVKEGAKVFLGGPPLVKMATGEDADDESLGGAEMHSRVSGLSDFLARDEADCLRLGREIVACLHWRKRGPGPTVAAEPPLHPDEDLLGLAPADLKMPVDALEVIARVVDGSRFSEFKASYGRSLVTGWASVHGFPVGILANQRGVLFSEDAQKAAQFIQLANQIDVPLVFLQNTTGYMVGRDYEQRGIIKDGAKMINAVANSCVPHVTVLVGASYGAGNYGMSGRSYAPRLLFAWTSSRTAVMGPRQLAGVLSIVARASAAASGRAFDEATDAERRARVEEQIERESEAFLNSGLLYDDGVIDPRDTRSVLGIALSACHSAEVRGAAGYGVFRM